MLGIVLGPLISIVDNVFRDTVEPVPGSIVYCDLALGAADHSGVYVGGGEVIHLDGSGVVGLVSASEFLDRLNGYNLAVSIYVSCIGNDPVGSAVAAWRARDMLGKVRQYSLALDNCHQFCSGCLSGDFENSDNFLWMLKHEAKKRLGADSWRVWDRGSYK